MRGIGKIKNILLAALMLVVISLQPSWAFEGPIEVKNQFPLFMNSLSPRLESARPEHSFNISYSYSSAFNLSKSSSTETAIDMEIAELSLRYRHIIAERGELAVDIPLINLDRGFMDNFLKHFHSMFELPNYGREQRPEDSFIYGIKKNRQTLISGKDAGTNIGDIRLSGKWLILDKDPALSVSAAIELPTGNAKKGYGSGSIDGGLAVHLDKQLRSDLMLYGTAGMILPGDIRAEADIPMRTSYYGGMGLEALLSRETAVILQAMYQTSPFPKTGIRNIDEPGIILLFGGRYTEGKKSLELSLTEDPNTTGAADFTINLSYKIRF